MDIDYFKVCELLDDLPIVFGNWFNASVYNVYKTPKQILLTAGIIRWLCGMISQFGNINDVSMTGSDVERLLLLSTIE